MFTPRQYRAKAAEFAELVKTANNPNELHEFREREQSFTALAKNEQWMTDNRGKMVQASERAG
jgi:hypothetical protein